MRKIALLLISCACSWLVEPMSSVSSAKSREIGALYP